MIENLDMEIRREYKDWSGRHGSEHAKRAKTIFYGIFIDVHFMHINIIFPLFFDPHRTRNK